MSERLTNEQVRELDERLRRAVPGEAIRVSSEELNAIRRGDVMFPNLTDAAELLVLRARVAKLEAALKLLADQVDIRGDMASDAEVVQLRLGDIRAVLKDTPQ